MPIREDKLGSPGLASAVQVWVDGASSGNPGPAGAGVVYVAGPGEAPVESQSIPGPRHEQRRRALRGAVRPGAGPPRTPERGRTVVLLTDSEYVVGLLARGYRARANLDLVSRTRDLAAQFSDLRVVWVRGHAGLPYNELADQLAREASRGAPTEASSTPSVASGRQALASTVESTPVESSLALDLSACAAPSRTSPRGDQLPLWPDPDPVTQVDSARRTRTPEHSEASAGRVDGWNDALDDVALPLARRLSSALDLCTAAPGGAHLPSPAWPGPRARSARWGTGWPPSRAPLRIWRPCDGSASRGSPPSSAKERPRETQREEEDDGSNPGCSGWTSSWSSAGVGPTGPTT